MEKRLILLSFLSLLFIGGCATMISGTDQPVTFDSMPQGATVIVDGKNIGKTPLIVDIPRKSKSAVEFTLDGYTSQTVDLKSGFNPWVLLNGIWCMSCVFSTTTDYASGAAYQYAPDKYFIALISEDHSETPIEIQIGKVKTFIVGNYSNLIGELSKISEKKKKKKSEDSLSFEYIDTLLDLLEIEKPEQEQAIKKIKTISESENDILRFADEVINTFIKQD
jgi:uncharacterized protein YceK